MSFSSRIGGGLLGSGFWTFAAAALSGSTTVSPGADPLRAEAAGRGEVGIAPPAIRCSAGDAPVGGTPETVGKGRRLRN